MDNAEYWIQHLQLIPHPEGGFYREIYRSNIEADKKGLHYTFNGPRRLCTSIYYLLRSGEFSRFHRLRSDEIWYYHYGSSIKIVIIDQEGHKHVKILGQRAEKAEHLQVFVPGGAIFGAELLNNNSFSIMSCLVSPGFEFEDFELFEKEDLLQAYPKHADIIEKLG